MPKNYVGISLDTSASMSPHARLAVADYNSLIAGLKDGAQAGGLDTIVSVVRCGVGYGATVERDVVNSSVAALKNLTDYRANGDGTPLWDSVGMLIDMLEATPDINDNEVSFLVMVITDGIENRSRHWSASNLRRKIMQLQGTDRWSFVFRVPMGYARDLTDKLGIPEGNVLEWEQTSRGFERATQSTATALRGYLSGVATGKRSTNRFYADLAGVTPSDLKRELENITDAVVIWNVTRASSIIKPFCETKSGQPYVKGRAFYELTKTETLQDYKQIAICERQTGKVYAGHGARDMLGIPTFGSIRLSPGMNPLYDIFVQSTSLNRVLPGGSRLLYIIKP